MVPTTKQAHEDHHDQHRPEQHEDLSNDAKGRYRTYSRGDRWFAPGDSVSLTGTSPGTPAEQGIVMEIFDDARAPLVYVRFLSTENRWMFTQDLCHTGSPETV